MIEGRDLTRRQGRGDEARPMRDQEAQPFGMLGGILGDEESLSRGGGIADKRQVEARRVVSLGEGPRDRQSRYHP